MKNKKIKINVEVFNKKIRVKGENNITNENKT